MRQADSSPQIKRASLVRITKPRGIKWSVQMTRESAPSRSSEEAGWTESQNNFGLMFEECSLEGRVGHRRNGPGKLVRTCLVTRWSSLTVRVVVLLRITFRSSAEISCDSRCVVFAITRSLYVSTVHQYTQCPFWFFILERYNLCSHWSQTVSQRKPKYNRIWIKENQTSIPGARIQRQ